MSGIPEVIPRQEESANIPEPSLRGGGRPSPRLREIALAAIASVTVGDAPEKQREKHEERLLRDLLLRVRARKKTLPALFDDWLRSPAPGEEPLLLIGHALRLLPAELLAVALAAAVEDDLLTGRILAHLQAPVGGSRPTLGLVTHALSQVTSTTRALLPLLLNGHAMSAGLLTMLDESSPVPERPVAVPTATCLALLGCDGHWPGTMIGLNHDLAVPLGDSALAEAVRHAQALDVDARRTLVIRTGSPSEGRAVAAAVAAALKRRPVFIETDKFHGMGPWLTLRRLVPVFYHELHPGERYTLPQIAGYDGPLLAVCGPDGFIETATGAAPNWFLSVPPQAERRSLWGSAVSESGLAVALSAEFRHGAGRISHLGRLARHHAAMAGRTQPERQDVLEAAWSGEAGGLESLAEPLRARIPEEALVISTDLRRDLESLLLRCRLRDELVAGLGVSAKARYRPGVRALLTGPSGTGKTLAAGWIATRLSLPLYRVDLAAVTSKYIGETEKNLSQLLARAEQAEVILLFDEADSLFGKRTDISDANDRFANSQTNYLLQRIENYDGIVLLTSNSHARFDPAFTRRIDFTIEFPHPGPQERRALWQSHLGPRTLLEPVVINQLAALLDVTGGHIRNAVLAAAVLARNAGRDIIFADIIVSVAVEYRKLGRQLPVEFQRSCASAPAK